MQQATYLCEVDSIAAACVITQSQGKQKSTSHGAPGRLDVAQMRRIRCDFR